MQQNTIQEPFEITGVGLHSGAKTKVRVKPAPCGEGISFQRVDLPGSKPIPARIENIGYKARRSALLVENAEIYTVEHFLAPCFALGIHNLRVEIDGPEMPGMDGSAMSFLQALQKAKIQSQGKPAEKIVVADSFRIEEGKASLEVSPHPGGLKIEYHLDHDVDYLPPSVLTVEIDAATFEKEIAPARTFVLKREVEYLLSQGLGKGANVENTLVIDEAGNVIQNTLRFPDEFIRHKILDLIGDLALTGKHIDAFILATRSGHSLNARLAKKLNGLL